MPALRAIQKPGFGVPKEEQNKVLQEAALNHVASFNFLLNEGLHAMVQNFPPLEMALPNGDRLKLQIRSCRVFNPAIKRGTMAKNYKVYPAECRGRHVSYKGSFQVTLSWSINGIVKEVIEQSIGEIPIMVKSQACNLDKLKPKQLVEVGEEENEFGGYFILNGLEKVVRLLIVQRRNYPIAMQRNSWKKRGDLFTDYGVAVRCVRRDQSGCNLVLHYLSDGSARLMFTYKREMYLVPVMIILKALVNETDYYIYKELIRGKECDTFFQGCIKSMLRKLASEQVFSQQQALQYIGEMFSVKLGLPSWYTREEEANFLIEQSIAVHLDTPKEKFDFLVFVIQKLFSAVQNECALESPDSLMNHEVLSPGHLMLVVIKEKLYSWQSSVKIQIDKKLKSADTVNQDIMNYCINHTASITRAVENIFTTGNFLPRYENSLQQFSGLVIVAEKLNYWRFLSHFRGVHRGAFFALT